MLSERGESDDVADPTQPRVRLLLLVVAGVLLALAVAGGVLGLQVRSDRAEAQQSRLEYGKVLVSAREEAEAFVNIRFDDAQASIEKVREGATGAFREQYDTSTESVIAVLEQNKSVMDGQVVWAGVSDLDDDSARVFVSTTGTVANKETGGEPVERNFRLQLDLVKVEGRWLTNNLEFVA